jgi:hypothetical protein
LSAFDFDVDPGKATLLEDVTIRRTGVRVDLVYGDETIRHFVDPLPPSATGATYWVEGTLTREFDTSGPVSLGRIQDTASLYDLSEGTYTLRLGYGPLSQTVKGQWVMPYPLLNVRLDPGSVNVQDDEFAVITADLSMALGEIEGRVTVSGADPGPGLALCVESTHTTPRFGLWCQDLAADGRFDLLLPAGPGHGLVCTADVVTRFGRCDPVDRDGRPLRSVPPPLSAFDFDVDRGRAKGVTFR